MISIECSDMQDLKIELAAYLLDKLPAVPLIRTNDIVLDPLTEDTEINLDDVRTYVNTFLASQNIDNDFLVSVNGNKIVVKGISGRKIHVAKADSGLLTCPHCGKVTPYEEEMNVHIRIHYIF